MQKTIRDVVGALPRPDGSAQYLIVVTDEGERLTLQMRNTLVHRLIEELLVAAARTGFEAWALPQAQTIAVVAARAGPDPRCPHEVQMVLQPAQRRRLGFVLPQGVARALRQSLPD